METFLNDVELKNLTSRAPVVVIDISSQWCGPCKQLHPILEEVEKQFDSSKVSIVKVDVTNGPTQFVIDMKIRMVPTLLFYKNGNLKFNDVGIKSKNELIEIINGLVDEK